MGNCRLAILARNGHFEDAKVILSHWRRIAVPVVEVADEVGAQGVRGPFAVDDVAIGLDVEAKLLITLGAMSAACMSANWAMRTRENFSRPPSVSSMVLIHCCALEKRLLRAPEKGSR